MFILYYSSYYAFITQLHWVESINLNLLEFDVNLNFEKITLNLTIKDCKKCYSKNLLNG